MSIVAMSTDYRVDVMSRNQMSIVAISTDYRVDVMSRNQMSIVAISTDYLGRCKSNYHTIGTTDSQ
jgi:uncharacterized protein YlxP (DUF503 family)